MRLEQALNTFSEAPSAAALLAPGLNGNIAVNWFPGSMKLAGREDDGRMMGPSLGEGASSFLSGLDNHALPYQPSSQVSCIPE